MSKLDIPDFLAWLEALRDTQNQQWETHKQMPFAIAHVVCETILAKAREMLESDPK